MSRFTRREFIGAAAVGATALMARPSTMLGAARKKLPIGVQLYSVRGDFTKDVPGVLAGIKKIGYDGVEFAGYASYGSNASGLPQERGRFQQDDRQRQTHHRQREWPDG